MGAVHGLAIATRVAWEVELMAFRDIEVLRTKSSDLIVHTLPDGSTAIFEVPTKNVYSLNPSAAAAWEACASATTLSQIAAAMSRKLGAPVNEDLAHEAVSELAAVGLVTVSHGERAGTSRREMLKVAGVALPVVLVLTGVEQRAHAQSAVSPPLTTSPPDGTTSTTTTTTTTTTPPPGQICEDFLIVIVKHLDIRAADGNPVPVGPLPGAVFRLFDSANTLIHTLPPTDANGRVQVTLSLAYGTYTLREDPNTPGGPYEPVENTIVVPQPSSSPCEWQRDIPNFRITT